MDTIHDFEDMLALLEKHEVRYLINGVFIEDCYIYRSKP